MEGYTYFGMYSDQLDNLVQAQQVQAASHRHSQGPCQTRQMVHKYKGIRQLLYLPRFAYQSFHDVIFMETYLVLHPGIKQVYCEQTWDSVSFNAAKKNFEKLVRFYKVSMVV
jgi:hypothetical protein